MAKNDLRARVYQAADELFIESGSLQSIGQRAVRERAKGGSNDVGPLLDDWRASREAMLGSRPAALAAIAEEFAGRLWLMAQLMSGGSGDSARPLPAQPLPAAPPPTTRPAQRTRPAPTKTGSAAPTAEPTGRLRGAGNVGLFSELPRPERPAKAPKPSAKRVATVRNFKIREAGQKLFVLVDPKPPLQPGVLTEADWTGARDEKLAEAVATILRKNGDRLRAFDIHKRLPKNLRPGTRDHAQRDLKLGLFGSRIEWANGGWFWFKGEPLPKHRMTLGTPAAEKRRQGDVLWWRIAHTIAGLGRDFTQAEIEDACGDEIRNFGDTWLRLRLTRMRERSEPFIQLVSAGIMRWTGLDPAEIVVED
ncbi:MAG: DNA-binding protein [Afipia sp.]|jgi:hypothetical protein|nr:DNA-binding protein [Afipia sp.]OYU89031.1 MAG: hypothetical protein CFE29_15975 [Bradyrhizobiaceae bacterium PARB1]